MVIMGAVGLALIKDNEGLRLGAYMDPVGIPTICYGHTGPEVRMGLRYTKAQCETILLQDVYVHRTGLAKCITAPVNPNQRDAMVSLAFNVGVTRVCKSTLVRKFNRLDYAGAALEFSKWQYASVSGRTVVLPGLVRRRAAERALFLTPVDEHMVKGASAVSELQNITEG